MLFHKKLISLVILSCRKKKTFFYINLFIKHASVEQTFVLIRLIHANNRESWFNPLFAQSL